MTTVNRALRIGIVIDGSIFEERLLRRRTNVTIGQSSRNVFSIPVDEMPMSTSMFTVRHGRYVLELRQGMDGRVFIDGELRTVAELLGGEATRSVDIDDDTRGKIEIGAAKILFQFVIAPPVQPRPTLPPALRRTLADRIDPALAAVLAVSLMAHLAIIIVAKQHDPPRSRYAQIYTATFDPSYDPLESFASARAPMQIPDNAPAASAPKASSPEKATRAPARRRNTRTRTAAATPETSVEITRGHVTRRVNELFSNDEVAAGRRGGMGHKRPGQDIGKVAEEIKRRGDRVELSKGDPRGPRSKTARRIGTGKQPAIAKTGTTRQTKSVERAPTSVVLVKKRPRSPTRTTLKPHMVEQKIVRVYMPQLRRCHQRILGRSPDAGGRVTIGFTVTASGRATAAWAKGFNAKVDACIRARANTWRFPKPREDGEGVSQGFALTLMLRAK